MNALLDYLQAFGGRAKGLLSEPRNYLAGLLESLPDRNSLQGAVKDPEFYKGLLGNTKEMAGGLLTGAVGAPVDIATMMMRPGGYNVPDKSVVGSSNHLAGLLGLDAESTPYKVGSLLPTDPGDALKYGGLLGMAGKSRLDDVMGKWRQAGVDASIYEKDGKIVLSKIVVPKESRSKGIGSAVMDDLARYADETGARIELSPSTDFGASSVDRLKKFYKRFGFTENKGRARDFSTSESMYREPKK